MNPCHQMHPALPTRPSCLSLHLSTSFERNPTRGQLLARFEVSFRCCTSVRGEVHRIIMDNSEETAHRSRMRSVVDEESDTVHVVTVGNQSERRESILRRRLRPRMESIPIREVIPDEERPVAVLQATSVSLMRYSLNYNFVLVSDAMRIEHGEQECEEDDIRLMPGRRRRQRVTVQLVHAQRKQKGKSALRTKKRTEVEMFNEALEESAEHLKRIRQLSGEDRADTTLQVGHGQIGQSSVATVFGTCTKRKWAHLEV